MLELRESCKIRCLTHVLQCLPHTAIQLRGHRTSITMHSPPTPQAPHCRVKTPYCLGIWSVALFCAMWNCLLLGFALKASVAFLESPSQRLVQSKENYHDQHNEALTNHREILICALGSNDERSSSFHFSQQRQRGKTKSQCSGPSDINRQYSDPEGPSTTYIRIVLVLPDC